MIIYLMFKTGTIYYYLLRNILKLILQAHARNVFRRIEYLIIGISRV